MNAQATVPDMTAIATQSTNGQATQSDRIVLLFDLSSTGHHPVFIRYLVRYWLETNQPGTLQVVVTSAFIEQCPDIVALANSDQRVQFTAVTIAESEHVWSQKSLISLAWSMWRVFDRYARELKATQALLMYVDIFQIPLALGAKSPCPLSGIYFRPTFHYEDFADYHPNWRDRFRAWRQKFLLAQALRHSQFQTLFSMDQFAVPAIQKLQPRVKVLPLADPIAIENDETVLDIELFRQQLGIEPGRKVFLLFGKISARKGVLQVLDAIQSLPDEAAKQVCLLLIGQISAGERSRVDARLAALTNSPSQIIVRDSYYDEPSLKAYLEIADVILAPYQHHVGTCATMLRAATVQKPVIVSNYGLMGELARHYHLGFVIDSTDVSEIARSLMNCLEEGVEIGDRDQMKQFAIANLWTDYARTIVETIAL